MSIVTERTWRQFAEDISYPSKPEDYCQTAVDKLMTKMDRHVVRVKGVKPQFKANNVVNIIPFLTQAGRDWYEDSIERYQRRKAKAEQKKAEGKDIGTDMLTAMLMLRIGAESNPDRAEHIAQAMYETVRSGKAAACACNFRISISKILHILMTKYHVPRSKISVIWGGNKVNTSAKKQAKKKILENSDLLDALESQGISLDDLKLGEDVELQEEIKFNADDKLGTQSRTQRQEEIDRFQRGDTLYCFFTFKAGGVGLSLHHTDELVTKYNTAAPGFDEYQKILDKVKLLPGKIRRKESGYYFEEDIKYVYTRPRELYCAPTYSAIELVQALGRCPRLTSLSDTNQFLIFFRGTIEERVAAITKMKLRCLSKVTRQHDDWNDIIDAEDREVSRRLEIASQETDDEEDSGLLGDGDDEE